MPRRPIHAGRQPLGGYRASQGRRGQIEIISTIDATPLAGNPWRLYGFYMDATNSTPLDLGNNETSSRGVSRETDGTFTAFTFSASRNFKTERGALRWLARRVAS